MINKEKMRSCKGKKVRILGTNGKIIEDFCYCYHQAEDEGEEPELEVGENWLIPQSQIKSIEILD